MISPAVCHPERNWERKAKIIAFYPTAKLKEEKWKIRHYGVIKRMTEASRQELFPDEKPGSPKAHKRYYKIELEKLEELPQPIASRRGDRGGEGVCDFPKHDNHVV